MPILFRAKAISRSLLLPLSAALFSAGGIGSALAATPSARLLAQAAAAVQPPRQSQPQNSAMDAELFYQLFVAEAELRRGEIGTSYQVMLDAARRTRDEGLFKRTVDIALAGRAADEALAALKAWRQAHPKSRQALELQGQLLMALGRYKDAQEPLRTLLEATPPAERGNMITALPRLIVAGNQAPQAARALEETLAPWKAQPATRSSADAAAARAWQIAGDPARSIELAASALQSDPDNTAAAAVALELMGKHPGAEPLVQAYVQRPQATSGLRLGYARQLTSAQRYAQALKTTESLTRDDPKFAQAWVMQGALQLELQQPRAAITSLQSYLALEEARVAALQNDGNDDAEDVDAPPEAGQDRAAIQELSQTYLMLAQATEQLKDYTGAQQWLDKLASVQNTPAVTLRRAGLLERQGKLQEALALIDQLPEGTDDELRTKVLGQTQLLREARQWKQAYGLLVKANQRIARDPDLLYEQAMLAEKLERQAEMEALLRQVIELKPDQPHAYNALGYSLADRKTRLPEARTLISKALELAPGDPFITDSAGWVEYRLGNLIGAEQLLRQAYAKRADPEIATHLGEVLWTMGRRDEARVLWTTARQKDGGNEVLAETLARLKVRL